MSTNTAATRGILPVPRSAYHADLLDDQPTLSASIAHILCAQSPAHAKAAHPRLNPDLVRQDEHKFDVGTAAHALFLEGDAGVQVVNADSWRTTIAQEARAEIRAAGRIPLLAKHFAEVQAMVDAVRQQLEAHNAQPPLFIEGKPEQTLIWDEDGVVCRARLDWLRDDFATVEDMKTTSRSANPEQFSRNLFGLGYDIKAAFYIRAVEAITDMAPEFRWVVVETYPPFALSVAAPGPDVLTIGRKKVEFALKVWAECLRADEWPGYPTSVCFAELPAYEESRWLEKEVRAA